MNDINNPCPSHESLTTYLYGECEPAERASMAAHVALCPLCAEELHALTDTRAHLASWSPPAVPLGFQITRTENDQPSKVLRPAVLASRSSKREGWWRQPLPAWAQAAAAVAIFAAGMSAGAVRSGSDGSRASATPAVTTPVATTVTRDELTRLNARLRSMENAQAQAVTLPRTAGGAVDERALLARVSAMIDARVVESERQNISLLAGAGRSLEAYREELAGRMEVVEEQQKDVQQFVGMRGLGSFQVSRASLPGR